VKATWSPRFKEKSSASWDKQKTPQSTHKAKFSIMYMTDPNLERCHCNYHSPVGWSEDSDPLELLMTSERTLRVPNLWLCPRNRVFCQGWPISQPNP
jgi:hypothetical protein